MPRKKGCMLQVFRITLCSVNNREATHYSHPLGNDRFAQRIEALTDFSVGQCRRARPRLIKE
jgi:hypothetical protein